MRKEAYDVCPLRREDMSAAAVICARAMNDNPIHIKVFGASSALRERRLRRFFSGLLAYVQRKGKLLGVFSDGRLAGVLGMLPPGDCKPTLRDFLQLMPALLTSNTPAGTVRLAIWLSIWARLDPSIPHWHLGPLAVDTSLQQQGIGTRLMDYAVSSTPGESLYLETDELANVRFYEGFGFSVLARQPVLSTPSWVMIRQA